MFQICTFNLENPWLNCSLLIALQRPLGVDGQKQKKRGEKSQVDVNIR